MQIARLAFLLTFVAVSAAAQDPCAVLPAGAAADSTQLESYERSAGMVAKCTGLYADGQAVLFAYNDPALAQQEVAKLSATDPRATFRPIDGLGDTSVELTKEQIPPGNVDSPVRYQIQFARGCATVFVGAGALANYISDDAGRAEWEAKKAWALATARNIDAQLQNVSLCSGGQAPTPPPPPPQIGTLSVTVRCDTNLAEADHIVCYAEPNGQATEASLTYSWILDGAPQSTTGATLDLSGVGAGSHTVTVAVADATSGQSSSPQSVTFAKSDPTATTPYTPPSNDDGLPLLPILIGTVIAGGVIGGGVLVTRGLRRRPPTDLSNAAGAPLPTSPAATTSSGSDNGTSDTVRAPQPIAAPPALAVNPPAASSNDPSRNSAYWLECTTPHVTIAGNTTQSLLIDVVARKRANGVVGDASSEMTASHVVSSDKRLIVTRRGGFYTLDLRARHAGNAAVQETITIHGAAPNGVVAPLTIHVTIEPVRIEVRIEVVKRGFAKQTVHVTLPRMVGRVAAVAETLAMPTVGGIVQHRIAGARCTAELRVGNGAWSTPADVRSASNGTFWFGVPLSLQQRFGTDGDSQDLHRPITLPFDATTAATLESYGATFIGFAHNLVNVKGGSYQSVIDDLRLYREQTFVRQIAERPEEDYDLAVSAIERLRAVLIFTAKYRSDVADQRRFVDLAAQECLSAVVDVITDFIEVAAMTYRFARWLAPKGMSGLVSAAAAAREIPGGRLMARGIFLVARHLRRPLDSASNLVDRLIARAMELAREHKLPTEYLERMASFHQSASLPTTDVGANAYVNDAIGELCTLGSTIVARLWASVRTLPLALIHGVLIVAITLGKSAVTAMRGVKWSDTDAPFVSALLEQVEASLGDIAADFYKAFGSIIDPLFGTIESEQEGAPKKPARSLAEVFMDSVGSTTEQLDREVVPLLRKVHDRAARLDVALDWREVRTRASLEERALINTIRERERYIALAGGASDYVKLGVKVFQTIALCWSTVASMIAYWLAVLAEKLEGLPLQGSVRRVLAGLASVEGAEVLNLHKKVERVVDVVDALVIRAVPLCYELSLLTTIRHLAAHRVEQLFEKESGR